ncbi:hypothetical protein [Paenibacillus koleovorans]|uniref:hypothetical protein n=1 Tax=Paenibacillus koleovorans TaxID=121608 RepID=UPI000FDA4438|nr:hypothetical protein [Paenibacillus koleovorans]
MNFDKVAFAKFLEQAKGKRSINKFGADAEVDPGYISRLMRCLIDSPPSAIIIGKLADRAYNNVSREDLMTAAGYLENEKEDQLQGSKKTEVEIDPNINVAYLGGVKHELTPEVARRLKEDIELFKRLKEEFQKEKGKSN